MTSQAERRRSRPKLLEVSILLYSFLLVFFLSHETYAQQTPLSDYFSCPQARIPAIIDTYTQGKKGIIHFAEKFLLQSTSPLIFNTSALERNVNIKLRVQEDSLLRISVASIPKQSLFVDVHLYTLQELETNLENAKAIKSLKSSDYEEDFHFQHVKTMTQALDSDVWYVLSFRPENTVGSVCPSIYLEFGVKPIEGVQQQILTTNKKYCSDITGYPPLSFKFKEKKGYDSIMSVNDFYTAKVGSKKVYEFTVPSKAKQWVLYLELNTDFMTGGALHAILFKNGDKRCESEDDCIFGFNKDTNQYVLSDLITPGDYTLLIYDEKPNALEKYRLKCIPFQIQVIIKPYKNNVHVKCEDNWLVKPVLPDSLDRIGFLSDISYGRTHFAKEFYPLFIQNYDEHNMETTEFTLKYESLVRIETQPRGISRADITIADASGEVVTTAKHNLLRVLPKGKYHLVIKFVFDSLKDECHAVPFEIAIEPAYLLKDAVQAIQDYFYPEETESPCAPMKLSANENGATVLDVHHESRKIQKNEEYTVSFRVDYPSFVSLSMNYDFITGSLRKTAILGADDKLHKSFEVSYFENNLFLYSKLDAGSYKLVITDTSKTIAWLTCSEYVTIHLSATPLDASKVVEARNTTVASPLKDELKHTTEENLQSKEAEDQCSTHGLPSTLVLDTTQVQLQNLFIRQTLRLPLQVKQRMLVTVDIRPKVLSLSVEDKDGRVLLKGTSSLLFIETPEDVEDLVLIIENSSESNCTHIEQLLVQAEKLQGQEAECGQLKVIPSALAVSTSNSYHGYHRLQALLDSKVRIEADPEIAYTISMKVSSGYATNDTIIVMVAQNGTTHNILASSMDIDAVGPAEISWKLRDYVSMQNLCFGMNLSITPAPHSVQEKQQQSDTAATKPLRILVTEVDPMEENVKESDSLVVDVSLEGADFKQEELEKILHDSIYLEESSDTIVHSHALKLKKKSTVAQFVFQFQYGGNYVMKFNNTNVVKVPDHFAQKPPKYSVQGTRATRPSLSTAPHISIASPSTSRTPSIKASSSPPAPVELSPPKATTIQPSSSVQPINSPKGIAKPTPSASHKISAVEERNFAENDDNYGALADNPFTTVGTFTNTFQAPPKQQLCKQNTCGCIYRDETKTTCIQQLGSCDDTFGTIRCYCKYPYAGSFCERCADGYTNYPQCIEPIALKIENAASGFILFVRAAILTIFGLLLGAVLIATIAKIVQRFRTRSYFPHSADKKVRNGAYKPRTPTEVVANSSISKPRRPYDEPVEQGDDLQLKKESGETLYEFPEQDTSLALQDEDENEKL